MAANINDKLKSTWNSASPAPTNPSAPRTPGATTLACVSLNWPTDTAVDFATFGKNADGSVNQASVQEFTGIVSGNSLTSVVLTSGGADQGNNITEFVVMKPTSKGHQDLVDAVKVAHNQDGSLKDNIVVTAKINDGAVTTTKINDGAITAAKLAGIYPVKRQNNTTNTLENARIETGWGWIQVGGSATAQIDENVTFQTPFSTLPIVVVTYGGDAGNTAASYGTGGGVALGAAGAKASHITTSGFKTTITTTGPTWPVGQTIYYQWIAIGA